MRVANMIKFRRNMGNLDRTIRIIVGVTLLIIGPVTNIFELTTILVIALGVIGTFAILSAIFAYCVLYEFTDIDTQK
jgi:hypothetical protein